MQRRYGHIPDLLGTTGSNALEDLCSAAFPPPESLDLRPLLVNEPILDQARTESCVRMAVARAIQVCARARGLKTFELPSPRHLTAITAALLRKPLPLGAITISACLEAIQGYAADANSGSGFCRISACPWQPQNDGVVYLEELQDGLDQREIRSHRVEEEWRDRIEVIHRLVDQGCGVIIGTLVDATFDDLGPGHQPWKQSQPILGGHAMAVVGYEPDAVLVCNSYSASWGDAGYGWLANSQVQNPVLTPSLWAVDFSPDYSRT